MIKYPIKLSTKLSKMVNSFYTLLKYSLTRFIRLAQASSQYCWLCAEHIEHPSAYTPSLHFCLECQEDLPSDPVQCIQCGLALHLGKHEDSAYDTAHWLRCGECIKETPVFSETCVPFRYEFPIKELIQALKYKRQRYWIGALAQALVNRIHEHEGYKHSRPDMIIPIPLHKKKLRQRGYNQAELIAKYIANKTGIPCQTKILLKQFETSNQAGLSKHKRLSNLRNSFSIAKKALSEKRIHQLHIALVDDVMTTKATAESAANCLLQAGAIRVDIWCLARTAKTRQLNTY